MTGTRFAPNWKLKTQVLGCLHRGNCTLTCPNISHITAILSPFKGFHYRTLFLIPKQLSLFPGYGISCVCDSEAQLQQSQYD